MAICGAVRGQACEWESQTWESDITLKGCQHPYHEQGVAQADGDGGGVLVERVPLVREHPSHEHDRHELEGLGQGLRGEGHVGKSLVLAPGRKHVRDGGKGVLVERCRAQSQRFPLVHPDQDGG